MDDMVTYKSYVGDIGTRIRSFLNTNISGATSIEYRIKKPNGNEVTWPCDIETITGGVVYHDIVSGEFDVSGRYEVQTLVEFTNGDRFFFFIIDFIVYGEYD